MKNMLFLVLLLPCYKSYTADDSQEGALQIVSTGSPGSASSGSSFQQVTFPNSSSASESDFDQDTLHEQFRRLLKICKDLCSITTQHDDMIEDMAHAIQRLEGHEENCNDMQEQINNLENRIEYQIGQDLSNIQQQLNGLENFIEESITDTNRPLNQLELQVALLELGDEQQLPGDRVLPNGYTANPSFRATPDGSTDDESE